MKRTIILLTSLILISYSISAIPKMSRTGTASADSIRILSTPDLYDLSLRWAIEYNKSFPEHIINVARISDNEMAGNLLQKGCISFVSDDYCSGLNGKSLWKAVIGRNVIVPVINSKNPFLEEIYRKGINSSGLANFLASRNSRNWGTLLNGNQNATSELYLDSDESISKGIEAFLKTSDLKIDGIKVDNSEAMIAAIQKDPFAIGFCKLSEIADVNNKSIAENISLLPIDRNGNGILDYNEKIYNDLNSFSRGVWIGKYPKDLISNIFSVSSQLPSNESEIAFLKWIFTDGQQYLHSNGYSDLLITERQTAVDNINKAVLSPGETTGGRILIKPIFVLFGFLIIAGFAINLLIRYIRRKNSEIPVKGYVPQTVLDENTLILPGGIYFDKTHTWAFMEQNGIVKVGIDDFLQHVTGTLTRAKMKNAGYVVKRGEPILSIVQNGKQLNVYSPVSGIILENNSALGKNASKLNSSPYNEGWVYRIEPTNWLRENQLLFMAERHRQYIKNELTRLKDFLAGILSAGNEKYTQTIYQDGGQLIDNTLEKLGPEVWEDFQSKFIDPARQVWFYELF